jgi:hypothetical protein
MHRYLTIESQSILFVILPFGTTCRGKTECKYRFTWSLRHTYQLPMRARYLTASLPVTQILYILLSFLRSNVIYEISSVEWRKQSRVSMKNEIYFLTSLFVSFLIINILIRAATSSAFSRKILLFDNFLSFLLFLFFSAFLTSFFTFFSDVF